MRKIAFHLNSLGFGGAERVVSNLANRFHRDGVEVVIATEWQEAQEYALDAGVRRVHVGLRKEDEGLDRVRKYLRRITYLRRFMQEEQPDVLVAFARLALYRALMACRGTGVPVVVSVRIDPWHDYVGPRNRFLTWRYMKRAAGAVFQTEDAKRFFHPWLQDGRVIFNPINEKYIGRPFQAPVRKEIVHVARLTDFKNQPLLVDAFAIVSSRYPAYVLKIYGPDSGDGSLERIRERIAVHHLEEKVQLMGLCDRLEEVLPGAAAFVCSSDYEGMPNSLLEAMALGLPVVSTDCPPGGPRMAIEDGVNGLLVPVGNVDRLAEGICRLIEHPEEAAAFGQRAMRICEVAGNEAVFAEWKKYLGEITGGTVTI
ncbi:MAG: glycosyltransferase [Butyrivibrio sp.]|nr:glycosyltransferase [Butyrivibrio sp.]